MMTSPWGLRRDGNVEDIWTAPYKIQNPVGKAFP